MDLWLLRIDLVNNSETQTESAMSEDQLFQKALDNNGESFKLWSAYVEWIEKKWQDDVLANNVVDDLLTVSDIIFCCKFYWIIVLTFLPCRTLAEKQPRCCHRSLTQQPNAML